MTTADGVPQLPSLGRIVHYRLAGGVILPAVVVYVWPGGDDPYLVNLQLFHNDDCGSEWVPSIPYSADADGSWFWPPRVG